MIYTEKEIKEWFKIMKKQYPNGAIIQHLESVEFMMFNNIFPSTNLKNIKKKENSKIQNFRTD